MWVLGGTVLLAAGALLWALRPGQPVALRPAKAAEATAPLAFDQGPADDAVAFPAPDPLVLALGVSFLDGVATDPTARRPTAVERGVPGDFPSGVPLRVASRSGALGSVPEPTHLLALALAILAGARLRMGRA
jgi:hypothetical protein